MRDPSIDVGGHERMVLAALLSLALLLPTAGEAGAARSGTPADAPARPSLTQQAADQLPDLRLHRLYGLTVRRTKNGRKLFRFGTRAFNIGAGPLEVRGRMPLDGRMSELVQWISDGQGGGRELAATGGAMFWAGDGHRHWHIEQFINVELYRTGNLGSTRLIRKIGFCLLDLVRSSNPPPHAPSTRVYGYTSCGSSQSVDAITMGISVGYADDYQPLIAHQWIDVTGLPRGVYRLCAKVDPRGHWLESNTANNFFWHDVWLNPARSAFRIRRSGRTPCGSYAGG